MPGISAPTIITPIRGARQGEFVVFEAASRPIGVLLADPATDRAWVRFRPRFDDLIEDTEVLDLLESDLRDKAAEMGAARLLDWFDDTLSNALGMSERRTVAVDAFTRVVEQLYDEHVDAREVREFETHLPLWSLRAACGNLGAEMRVEAEDWVPAPEGMRVSRDHFVAHAVGDSMEPRIPEGSLNLFKYHPAGSRSGRILLIERFGITDETARFTIKRYKSFKREFEDGTWEHERIRLEPLNPKHDAWDVGPQDFAVVAEWIRVLE